MPTYTHTDRSGMRWRFVGARPVSELADKVMGYALPAKYKPKKPKKPKVTKKDVKR